MKLLMSAEIDCADERGAYVELKTSRQMDSERQLANFEKHKLLKFWLQVVRGPLTTAHLLLPPTYYRPLTTAHLLPPCSTAPRYRTVLPPHTTAPLLWPQSFLAGVPRIIVGFRDDAGVVKELRPLETMKIPRMVRGMQASPCRVLHPLTVPRTIPPNCAASEPRYRAACHTPLQCCVLHPSPLCTPLHQVRGKQDMWDPAACLNFGKAVLEWLQHHVRQLPAGASALLRYVPAEGALLLLRQHGEGEAPAAKRAAPSDWP